MKTCVQLNSERSERFHHKLNNMCLVGEGLECNHYKLGNGKLGSPCLELGWFERGK